MKREFIFLLVLIFSSSAFAETIEFEDSELARESVLPVFDNPSIVRSRTVKTKGRIEIGANLGASLNEAFYNTLNYGFMLGYHLDETHALEFTYGQFAKGLSSYGEQLRRGDGLEAPNTFDASLAPSPESQIALNYHFTAYYGKISLSKRTVMNLSLYFGMGIGTIDFGEQQNVIINLMMGQRIYFSDSVALRFDLTLLTYDGPDPTSAALPAGGGVKPYSAFSEKLYINPSFNGGLVILL